MLSGVWFSFFFFFQAEDGIRYYKVTGVQRVLFRSRGNSHHNRFYSSYLVIGYPIFLSNSKVRSYSWITCDGHGRRKMYHQCSLRIKSLIIAGRFVEFVKRLRLFLRKHYLNPIKVQRWGLGNPRK